MYACLLRSIPNTSVRKQTQAQKLYIQLQLHLFLRFLLEALHLLCIQARQVVHGLDAETPQEFLRSPEQNRFPRRVQPPALAHQIILTA